MMVLRSLLFVPGNSMRMITKAATLVADGIIFDLEDAVPLADKETARIMVRDSLKAVKSDGIYLFVRVNALITGLTGEDIQRVAVDGLDGILLPKAEARSDVAELDGMLEKAEKAQGLQPGTFQIIPLVETAKGVMNAFEIATASQRIAVVSFGAGDFLRDMGRSASSITPEQTELLFARSQVVTASRAAGLPALDTVFLGLLTDREGFEREALIALQLGFKGKMLIHPTQIEMANRIFSPSAEEAAEARKVVAAFEEAQSRGLGAISFEGKMIDIMSYRQARDLVNFVDFIAEREKTAQRNIPVSIFRFFSSNP